jgi:4-methyl-5(b-hydroxyethyl)-thiazole monophosphate biosynthesis
MVLVPLAEGFEETEAVALIDVLRRADLNVVTAGLQPGPVTGSHGITVVPDATLAEVDLAEVDALVLPGGMPGTTHLMEDECILGLARRLAEERRPVAAICAAPRVLATAGLIDGLEVTSHPGVRELLGGARVLDTPRVVRATHASGGAVVTSQGPGTALELGLALVADWVGADRAESLREAMLVQP